MPQRSKDRFNLLKEVEKKINNPTITSWKIRNWFNNNQDKLKNYMQNDEPDGIE